MSEVFSFRLSDNNPRELHAKEIISVWVSKGYSLRYILTEALLILDKSDFRTNPKELDEINDSIERLANLVDKLEGRLNHIQPLSRMESGLSETFKSSIKLASKPGLRINNP